MKKIKELNVVIPIALDEDGQTVDQIVEQVIEQHQNFGFHRFMFTFPSKGFCSAEPPANAYIEEHARNFKTIKQRLSPLGIECGWWFWTSIETGHFDHFTGLTSPDGKESFSAMCPLDPVFEAWIYQLVTTFVEIARPSFMFMEDDMTISRHTSSDGCYCKYHLEEFAKRMGRFYTPEELVETFHNGTPEAIELRRKWRELSKYALVVHSENVRRAVDTIDPSIPIGAMQSGASDKDGDCSYSVAKALAGDKHTPFSRLYGAMYNGVRAQDIPSALFHSTYSRQHITEDFEYLFESDCYPHTRFFTSGKEMQAMIAAVYSAGYDGSTLQTQQGLDDANEDTAFGYAFAKERPRHEAIHKLAKQCELKGVEITYDPFYNTIDANDELGFDKHPFWTQTVSLMGIPYTTLRSEIAFWDYRIARFYPHEKVMDYLSHTLFLDGEAAKALCERGYGEYLGVDVGEDTAVGSFKHDLCAREIICQPYAPDSPGRNMVIAHVGGFGQGGKLLELKITDATTQVLTEAYTFKREFVCPAMTRFKNKLGGTVIVMGLTVHGNYSQPLLNYRRQKLFHQLIAEAWDEVVLAKNAPRIFTLMNEPKEGNRDFIGALTLINLSSDDQESLTLHLPEKWKGYKQILAMDAAGNWQDAVFTATSDGIKIHVDAAYLKPVYLLFR